MATQTSLLARAKTACAKFKAEFPGQVVAEGDTGYEAEIDRSWSITSRNPATAYVHLTNADEVAKALFIVKETESRFAIRSGGHNANPGFSSVPSADEAGVILDVSRLKSKRLDAESGTAHLGAGNNWLEIFTWLEEQKLSVIGSREGRVGLSGFLLGGQGIFSGLHGLGADGVKGFEVVLADGTLVNANADSHPELFRSLKGGGSNFGIVTAVSLETHPLIKLQHTINMYNPSDCENVIKAFVEVQKSMETDEKIGMFINSRKDYIAIGLFYADWLDNLPAVFEPYNRLTSLIAPIVPTSNGTFSSLNTILEEWAYKEPHLKHAYVTLTTKVSEELYVEAHRAWKEEVEHLPKTVDLHWSIQPLSQTAVKAGKKRGGNILGLEDVPQSCWIFSCDWKDDEFDEDVKKTLNALLRRLEGLAVDRDLKLDLIFPTFAGGAQDVINSFGPESVKSIKETAARYDPEGVFQKLQCGGFLLRDL
ncbi:hypothetical protein BJ166DRAFT_211070 [Pestalotiopsis sp. NC0098]|nr:hypothetical protein BJ166DRAFT_211070 [Pestalotiopsis sp. NC0098]